MDSWVSLVRDVGFPIVLVFYLLKDRKELTKALENNTLALQRLANKLGKDIENVVD